MNYLSRHNYSSTQNFIATVVSTGLLVLKADVLNALIQGSYRAPGVRTHDNLDRDNSLFVIISDTLRGVIDHEHMPHAMERFMWCQIHQV